MLELLIILAVILVLVGLNGLFVASEFSIISASRPALGALAVRGDRLARAASSIVEDPLRLDRYVATAQLGITFASLGLGMYGEHNLARIIDGWIALTGFSGLGAALTSHGIAVVISLVIVTYLHVVLGEMVPKSLALTHAIPTARLVMRPMMVMGWVLGPLVRLLNRTGNAVLRLAGFHRGRSRSQYYDPDELQAVVRESRQSGLIPEEGERVFKEMIHFSDLSAGETMVPRVAVVSLPLHGSMQEIRRTIAEHPHTRYPVIGADLDDVLGSVHIRDLLELLVKDAELDRSCLRAVPFVPMTVTLEEVIAAMNASSNQLAVVMDEHGGTAGIVTIEDICCEAIGDVEEGSGEVPELVRHDKDTYRARGTLRLDTLGFALARRIEQPDVVTVSGLFLARLGRAARAGDTIAVNGLTMKVTGIRGRGVAEAEIRIAPAQLEADRPMDRAED
jgi:CBS domain containing-hemolysin-like protein